MYTTSLPPANKIVKPTPLKLAVNLNIYYNMSNMETLDLLNLRKGYEPSTEAVETLRLSGLSIVGNQVFSSGKDALLEEVIRLSRFAGVPYEFIPSRKTRPCRLGEEDGIQMVHTPIDEAVTEVRAGRYIEWEPLRGTEINGTHIEELRRVQGRAKPIKDVDTVGQATLRALDPNIRTVYPLPDLKYWSEMIRKREGVPGRSLRSFLSGNVSRADMRDFTEHGGEVETLAKTKADILKRLEVAAAERCVVENLGFHQNPRTLFIINRFGELTASAMLSLRFLERGESISDIGSRDCLGEADTLDYLSSVRNKAEELIESTTKS